MRRLLLAAAIALLATAAPAAAVTVTDLAPVASDTPLSAYGGHVVWSEQGADGLYRLVDWHDGAKTTTVAAPRRVPFDADAGPGALDRPRVTFSRCAPEPDFSTQQPWAAARHCRLRQVALPGGGESAIPVPRTGASDSTPSLWGYRVAFQRRATGAPLSQLMTYDLRTRTLKRLRHGVVPAGAKDATAELGEIDLGARTVAFSWHVDAPGVSTGVGAVWEMRAERLSDTRTVLAGSGYVSGACGARTPYSPNATASGLVFLSRALPCERVDGTITATTIGSGLLSRAAPLTGGTTLWRIARDAATGVTYGLLGPVHGPGALRLVRLDALTLGQTNRRASAPFVTG